MDQILKTFSQSKWCSRKLLLAVPTLVTMVFQMFSVSDKNQQIAYGAAAAFVSGIYSLAQGIVDARTAANTAVGSVTAAQISALISDISKIKAVVLPTTAPAPVPNPASASSTTKPQAP